MLGFVTSFVVLPNMNFVISLLDYFAFHTITVEAGAFMDIFSFNKTYMKYMSEKEKICVK